MLFRSPSQLPLLLLLLVLLIFSPTAHLGVTAAVSSSVSVDPDSRGLVVDGLPLFPVGFYVKQQGKQTPPKSWDITSEAFLGIPAAEAMQGFSHMSPYLSTNICMSAPNLSSTVAMLEAADRAGMHASLDLFRIVSGYDFHGSHCTPEAKNDTLRLAVEAAAHNQGLLFYYLMDEPSEKTFPLPTVQAAVKTIRTIDQDHPVAACFRPGGLQKNPEYAHEVDIIMTDPVGHHRYICGFQTD